MPEVYAVKTEVELEHRPGEDQGDGLFFSFIGELLLVKEAALVTGFGEIMRGGGYRIMREVDFLRGILKGPFPVFRSRGEKPRIIQGDALHISSSVSLAILPLTGAKFHPFPSTHSRGFRG